MSDHLDLEGWLISEVEADLMFSEARVRLLLFRTAATWSLLQIRHRTEYSRDGSGQPVGGSASAWVETFDSLEALRIAIERQYRSSTWRELVRVGAGNPHYDPDLMALWGPVQVDLDLDKASVHLRELAMAGEAEALAHAVVRLEELGFVIFETTATATEVFPRRLIEDWGNPVLGAVIAARHGLMVSLLVAVDSAGEVYTRTADHGAEPGAERRFPARPLTDQEWEVVEEAKRQRRAEVRRRLEEHGRG